MGYTDEMRAAVASLAIRTRWYGRDSAQAMAAAREVCALKLANARAEADRLQAELDALGAAS